ncbi:hypothetical protein D3C81_1873130 [compost metagenome]
MPFCTAGYCLPNILYALLTKANLGLWVETDDFENTLPTMHFCIDAANQLTALQHRQRKVTILPFFFRRVAFQPVIKIE